MALSLDIANFVVFIGNPGCGKSTLLNCILKENSFKSGVSFGKGLTSVLSIVKKDGITYGDTPGLSDVKLREQAAKEIEEILKKNCEYKIFFVCTLESGRVKPDDLTTIEVVLNSIKLQNFFYSIIVNKITSKTFKILKDNKNKERETLEGYFDTLKPIPLNFHYVERKEDLEDTDNALIELPALAEFVQKSPQTYIKRDVVTKVDSQSYETLKANKEKQIEELKNNNQKLEDLINEKAKEHQLLLEEALKVTPWKVLQNIGTLIKEGLKELDIKLGSLFS